MIFNDERPIYGLERLVFRAQDRDWRTDREMGPRVVEQYNPTRKDLFVMCQEYQVDHEAMWGYICQVKKSWTRSGLYVDVADWQMHQLESPSMVATEVFLYWADEDQPGQTNCERIHYASEESVDKVMARHGRTPAEIELWHNQLAWLRHNMHVDTVTAGRIAIHVDDPERVVFRPGRVVFQERAEKWGGRKQAISTLLLDNQATPSFWPIPTGTIYTYSFGSEDYEESSTPGPAEDDYEGDSDA